MTLAAFVPPLSPSAGTSEKPEIKILKAEFGDGYTQAARDGMNNIRRVMTLKWEVLTSPQAKIITDFMSAQGGVDPFLYKIPGEDTAFVWTCEDYSENYLANGLRSIEATIRQSFNLVS